MSAPLVVLDWIVVSPDGTFVKEGKSSVLRMTSILAPRKEFHQYKVGEEVKAKFCGKEYRAEIIAIGSTENKAHLMAIAEGKIPSNATLDSHSTSATLAEKSPSPTSVTPAKVRGLPRSATPVKVEPIPTSTSSAKVASEPRTTKEEVNVVIETISKATESTNSMAPTEVEINSSVTVPSVNGENPRKRNVNEPEVIVEPKSDVSRDSMPSPPLFERQRPQDEELKKLKADFAHLQRKVRRLEKTVDDMRKASAEPPALVMGAHSSARETESTTLSAVQLDCGFSEQELLEKAKFFGPGSKAEALKALAKTIFTEDKLIESSVTGKKPGKSGENPRPPLNAEKLGLLKRLMQRVDPCFQQRWLTEGLQSIQKVLRAKQKSKGLKKLD